MSKTAHLSAHIANGHFLFRGLLLVSQFLTFSAVTAQEAALPEKTRLVVAIRYMQVTGTSHAHLFLYSGDGKLIRQLTNATDGQDRDPVFSADGKTIVFRREEKGKGDLWLVPADVGKAQRLTSIPSWYFTSLKHGKQQFEFPWIATGTDEHDIRIAGSTAADDLHYPAPDGTSEIVLKNRPQDNGSIDWFPKEPWLRQKDQPDIRVSELPLRTLEASANTAEQTMRNAAGPNERYTSEADALGPLDGILAYQGSPFIWKPPLRIAIMRQHRGSTFGDASFAVDLNTRTLHELTPTSGDIIQMEKLRGFFCICSERYLPLGDGKRTVNCTFLDLWDAQLKRIRFSAPKVAQFYGGSVWLPTEYEPEVTFIPGEAEWP